MDILSKSDPQVYVFKQNVDEGKWHEIGRTEMINDNLNPKFAKAIITTFKFEEQQRLRFVVIDVDKENGKIADQDLIGTLISFSIFFTTFKNRQIIFSLI